MDKKRECWIDALRGMAMLLVVLGHCERWFLYNAIYLVNVPLFICISGYIYGIKLSDNNVKKENFLKILKNHVYPYVTFGILYEIIKYANSLMEVTQFGVLENHNLRSVFLNFIQFDAGTNWFLIPFAFSEALLLGIITLFNILFREKKRMRLLEIVLVCGIALAVLLFIESIDLDVLVIAKHEFVTACLRQWFYAFQRSFVFLFYLGLGITFFYIVNAKWARNVVKIILVVVMVAIVSFMYDPSDNSFSEVRWLNQTNTIKYLVMSTCGCFAMFLLFSFAGEMNFLQYIGKNTLVINGTHLTLGTLDLVARWYYRYTFSAVVPPIVNSIILSGLVMLFEIIIIIPLFRDALGFMTDYKIIKERFKSLFEKNR